MTRAFLPPLITDDRALGGSTIERSLRFDNASSGRLTRTIGSTVIEELLLIVGG